MAQMAHVYRIVFTRNPVAGEPYIWQKSEPVEVTAMSQDTAVRLARKCLALDAREDGSRWVVSRPDCLDLGAWNKVEA